MTTKLNKETASININVNDNNAEQIGWFILAINKGELIHIDSQINETKYIGKYLYNGCNYLIELEMIELRMDKPLCIGDGLRINELIWQQN